MSRPFLTIIRGLPGMGKSTRARKYAEESGALLIEPDMFLTRHGEYSYSEIEFKYAVARAKHVLAEAARAGADAIYADVLPTRRDVRDVIVCYKAFCYVEDGPIVNVIEMGPVDAALSFQRNRHGVKREDVERMALEWEPWDTWKEEES